MIWAKVAHLHQASSVLPKLCRVEFFEEMRFLALFYFVPNRRTFGVIWSSSFDRRVICIHDYSGWANVMITLVYGNGTNNSHRNTHVYIYERKGTGHVLVWE